MKILIHEHYDVGFCKVILRLMNRLRKDDPWTSWGVTLWNHIFYSSSTASLAHRRHERVHAEQMLLRPFAWMTFWIQYSLLSLKELVRSRSLMDAYWNNPLEQEARRGELNSVYDPATFDRALEDEALEIRFAAEAAVVVTLLVVVVRQFVV